MVYLRFELALIMTAALACGSGFAQERGGSDAPGEYFAPHEQSFFMAPSWPGEEGIPSGGAPGATAAPRAEAGGGASGPVEAGTPPSRGGARRGPGGQVARGGMFGQPVLAKDDDEKRILDTLDAARAGMQYRNVPEEDGRLLRVLAETIGAKRVVEIGTSTGESALWFTLALRRTGGELITHEIDPQRAEVARQNFKRAGVDGMITVVEGDAHQTISRHKDPIDILFLDADKEGYIDYLDKLLPLIRPGGLVIAHNMNERQADPSYVKAITTHPALETIFLHMDRSGVGVTLKKR